jgi:hypothetical protein
MTTIQTIRSRRLAEEIPAALLAARAGINRMRVSFLERGHAQATDEELERLFSALEQLVAAKAKVREAATEAGWPMEALT